MGFAGMTAFVRALVLLARRPLLPFGAFALVRAPVVPWPLATLFGIPVPGTTIRLIPVVVGAVATVVAPVVGSGHRTS